MRLSELQSKDMISTKDGKKIGRIIDAEIIKEEGKIIYFVVEPKHLIKSFISGNKETTVTINQINKIGEDVILVDFDSQ